MNSSLFYDAPSSRYVSGPLERDPDAFLASYLNGLFDSPSAACSETAPYIHDPPLESDATFASTSEDGHPLSTVDFGSPLYAQLDVNVDQEWLPPVESSSPPSFQCPDFSVDGSYARENEYTSMTSAPPLYLDPAVLSSSQTLGLAQSLQSTSLPEQTNAQLHLPRTPSYLPRNDQLADTSSSSGHTSYSDWDLGGDTDGDAADGDYTPSHTSRRSKPRSSPYKRTIPRRAPHNVHSISPPSSPSSSSTSSTPTRPLRRARPRNIQVDVPPSTLDDLPTDGPWMCPAPGCDHVHATRRMPDFRRHMRTHRARDSGEAWVCCGVRLADAPAYGVADVSEPYEYKGFTMVGGCLKEFSRKDALIRHLRNERIRCPGDADMAERLGRE